MNSDIPFWIEMRETRESGTPLRDLGSTERVRQMFFKSYDRAIKPPTPLVAGGSVALPAKVAYQWESLAMHYFHGSHERPPH